MSIFSVTRVLLLALLCTVLWSASYDDRLAAMDQASAQAHFELAEWCREQGQFSRAARHLREAVRIDPDHAPARQAMGFLWYNDAWVHQSRVPGAGQPRGTEEQRIRGPRRPGPSAEQMTWDLTLPPDPDPHSEAWLDSIMDSIHSAGNWSREMNSGIATLMMPQYRPSAPAALARYLSRPGQVDLWAVSEVVNRELADGGPEGVARARALLPFMVSASTRSKDPEGLYAFAIAAGRIGDQRVVPRLIELLEQGGDAASGARDGLHLITGLPAQEIDLKRARTWWNDSHDRSQVDVWRDQMSTGSLAARLAACKKLFAVGDTAIVPTLIDLAAGENPHISVQAAQLLLESTGSDWGLAGREDDTAQVRAERARQARAWWQDNAAGWVFPGQREAQKERSTRPGPARWVADLANLDATVATAATDNLLGAHRQDAVPALLDGLESPDAIIRQKSFEILQRIAGQRFGYEPIRGDTAERGRAVERWAAWAREQGYLHDDHDQE